MWKIIFLSFYLHLNKKWHVQNYSYPLQTVYGKIQSSIPFQIVQAVLKHPNYPDSLGTAVLIYSRGEKQQLSAVGLWTVMSKTKELTEDLWLRIVADHKSGKGYNAIFKCFQVPVATVQSITKKYKDYKCMSHVEYPHCNTCDLIVIGTYSLLGSPLRGPGPSH